MSFLKRRSLPPAGDSRIQARGVVGDVERAIVALHDLQPREERRIEERRGDLSDSAAQHVFHVRRAGDARGELPTARRGTRTDLLVEVVFLPGRQEHAARRTRWSV